MQLGAAAALTRDTWTLSMSTSNELEPGPKSFPELCARERVEALSIPVESRKARMKARHSGWGGFTGG